ncbi:hypothetical protein Tco_1042626 [Tanacetum coccineum]|uniref:Uncharacterized protein n=1 Tax=Tanacetum coccineum TaxID=301880 RepID=A0ABQ5GJN2_9ASTR
MANENVPAPAPTRSDDQILPFAAWVPIGKSNFALDLQKKQNNPIFLISMDIVQNTNFFRAFTTSASVPTIYIQQFWNTLTYEAKTEAYSFYINVDYAELMWEEFVQAIQTFLTDKATLGSPTKKGRKDKPHVIPYYLRFGNLKFVPKGEDDEVFGMPIPNELITNNIRNAPYYNAYLEMVAKHDQKIAAEKGGNKTPATAKQLKPKPVKEKSSKPAPAPKPKVTQMNQLNLKLNLNPKHREGDEYDVEQAIQMSLESFQAQIQAHVGSVAIREPRRTPTTEEASTGHSAQPQDDTSANIVCESPSPADAETGADTDKSNNGGQARSDPGKTLESRPPPEQVFMDEGQAGPDPGKSRVALAGPNPKPTHDDFMANVYPNVHESLKFPADEHVILEDPLSSSGTLSSMKNLDDAYIIGDHIFLSSSPPKLVPSIIQAPIFTATTATTTTTLPPPPQQQNITDSELAARVTALENKFYHFKQKSNTLDNTNQNLRSRFFTLKLLDLPHKINQTVNEVVKVAVHVALQAPPKDRFRELPEADMKEILHQWMFESGTYKSLPEHVALYEDLKASMERANRDEFFAKKDKSRKRRRDDQDPPPPPPDSDLSKKRRHAFDASVEDVPILDNVNVSDSEDTDTVHLPKIKTRPYWLKPIPEEDRPTTPEPDWFHMEECQLLLTDQVDLVNPEGHRIVPDVSKPLPLGGPPGQVTIQSQFFFNKDLDYLVSNSQERRSALSISKLKATNYPDFGLEELVPSLWIESECEYDISAAYGISHCVVSLKTYERYEYTFLKEIVLCRADYKEYKISEADFKNRHPNDFEDLYLLHLQGHLNHLLGADKVHLFNAVNLWIRNIVIKKQDYTIISKSRAVIYRDRNDQNKMMRKTKVHKFSNGTLNSILDKLDHMVKDFKLFKYNPGIKTRIWFVDDRKRSKDFMEVIERRLKIRRIFRSLESFVGGRIRDVDYRLIQRTE